MPELQRPKAVLFDLDGTLYIQKRLRRAMAWRLVRGHVRQPWNGLRTMRILSAYRTAQEQLRESNGCDQPVAGLAAAQLALACERTRADESLVRDCVTRWMETEPLDLVARYARPGLVELLEGCRASGVLLGVVSDYPAAAKLAALGVANYFDVVLTAQSPDVDVFKPNPRGLQVAMDRLGVVPSECVYIGDRAEVDGAAATAAGMCCLLVSTTSDFGQIQHELFGQPAAQPFLDPA
jgi:putative hydrolase of the HAD superfamily